MRVLQAVAPRVLFAVLQGRVVMQARERYLLFLLLRHSAWVWSSVGANATEYKIEIKKIQRSSLGTNFKYNKGQERSVVFHHIQKTRAVPESGLAWHCPFVFTNRKRFFYVLLQGQIL